MKYKSKGITLISLVITIITMLILAGIAISQLSKNGILLKTETAKMKEIKAEMKEKLLISLSDLQIEKEGKAHLNDITQSWLDNKLPEYKNIITSNLETNSKIITLKNNGIIQTYEIDSDFNIYEIEDDNEINFTYEIIEKKENTAKILIEIIEKNGIKEIILPNSDDTTQCGGSKKYSTECTVEMDKKYELRITIQNGREKQAIVIVNSKTTIPEPVITLKDTGLYPTFTEYGLLVNSKVNIDFKTNENITNYYSTNNGNTWQEYKGEFESNATSIIAKSIENTSRQQVSTTKILNSTSSNALQSNAYNGNTDSWHTVGTEGRYVLVDKSMANKSILIYSLGNSNNNYNDRYAYVSYLDENDNILETSTSSLIRYGWYTNNQHHIYTLESTIPMGTNKIRFYGNKNDVSIADIKIKNEPIINPTKYYSILSENGIIQGYNNITLSYDNTSEKRIYKIGDNGDWLDYQNKEIRLEIGEKLYAKGIDKNNDETRIISEYTAIFPSDGLNLNAYDGNTNSWHTVGTGSYYILIDKSMENKSIHINVLGNSSNNYNDRYAYVSYLDENNNILGTSTSSLIRYGWYTNNWHSTYTLESTIPVGTKKLKFYGNKGDVSIANISIIDK